MALPLLLNVFLALLTLSLIMALTLVLCWFIMTAFYLKLTHDGEGNPMVTYTLLDLLTQLLYGPFLFAGAAAVAAGETLSVAKDNVFQLIVAFVFIGASFAVYAYMDVFVINIVLYYQLLARPLLDFIALPFGNIVRIVFDILVGFTNYVGNLTQFVVFGGPELFFQCTTETFKFANLIQYFMTLVRAVFTDFRVWVTGEPFVREFNIVNSLVAIGDVANIFLPTFTCFCKMLNFLWIYIITILNFPSLHSAINNFWNVLIRFLQVFPAIIVTPGHRPDLEPLTITACMAVQDGGDVVEQFIFLTSETLYGLISRQPDLPPVIGEFLSVNYSSIITHPVCGAFKLINMTITGAININQLANVNATFLQYLQFGFIFDELKVATLGFSGLFVVLGVPDLTSLITYILFAAIDLVAFLFEWVIGTIIFIIYGATDGLPASFGLYNVSIVPPNSRNAWLYYLTDYWMKAIPLNQTSAITIGNYTYSSALNSFLFDIAMIDLNLGNLLALANVPLGQTLRFTLNALLGLIKFLVNFVAYSYNLIFFQMQSPMPTTPNYIDLEYFYNQTFFLAGAAGDIFRQFSQNSTLCATVYAEVDSPGSDTDKAFFCAIGNLIENFFDFVIIVVKELTDFIQDILTMITGGLQPCIFGIFDAGKQTACIRIPNFATSLDKLDDSLCNAANAATGLIPESVTIFRCKFKIVPPVGAPGEATPQPKRCNRVQTCLALELCAILTLFISTPLRIANQFLFQILSKSPFMSAVGDKGFITYGTSELIDKLVAVFEYLGLALDCVVCAFSSADSSQCLSPIYDFFHLIGDAARQLVRVVTNIFLNVVKLVILFIVGLFTGNPINATIDFIIGIFTDLGVALGQAVLGFIIKLLNALNLSFLSGFITVVYKGLCYTLQVILNIILIAIRVLTLGFVNKEVNFCCGLDSNCTTTGLKRSNSFNGIDFINTDVDTWLLAVTEQYNYTWPVDDHCNTTIGPYTRMNWTSMDDYQQGEVMHCFVKQMWLIRTDNQTFIGNTTCDGMILELGNFSWSTLGVHDKRKLIECMNERLYIELLREQTGLKWIPQDLWTNPFRKWYFGAEMIRGYLINYQFFSDRTKPTDVILSKAYQDNFKQLGLNVDLYANLSTVDDVIDFKQRIHLEAYFVANNATQYDAVLYTVTGIWTVADSLLKGLYNTSVAMAGNTTDPMVYLSYNYSLDNSVGGTSSALFGVIAELGAMMSQFTEYWKNPDNYKKRSEAYGNLTQVAYILYHEAYNQIRLMAWEAIGKEKVRDGYFNSTCSSQEECDAAGVTAFAEEYRKSMRGEDQFHGETSIVYKLSRWWDRVNFTVYPIQNPRYPPLNTKIPAGSVAYTGLSYRHKNGTMLTETARERFWRYVGLVREGDTKSNRRWERLTSVLQYTRDKVYTKVLKSFYGPDAYQNTDHHQYMHKRHQLWRAAAAAEDARRSSRRDPLRSTTNCVNDSACVQTFALNSIAPISHDYDVDVWSSTRFSDEKVQDIKRAMMSSETVALQNEAFVDMWLQSSQFFAQDTINRVEIVFPCAYPLECNGTFTTLTVQCLYLQVAIDRVIAATTNLINLYSPNGQFYRSLNETYQFFQYSYDTNASVIVGSSPSLSVRRFPAYGATFLDSFHASMEYFNDNVPNKTGFSEFILADQPFVNQSDADYRNSTFFTAVEPGTINYYVLWIADRFFSRALRFFDNVVQTLFNTRTPATSVINQVANELIFCNYTQDMTGQTRRYSVGQIVAMALGVFLPGVTLMIFLFGFDPLMFVLGSGVATFLLFGTFMVLHGDTALFCVGFPVQLGDSIFYSIAFNFLPKCPWYFGALIEGEYNNDNCYLYDNIKNHNATNCFTKEGFKDALYLLVFYLQAYAPQALNFIRTTTIPPFPSLYSLPGFAARINYFNGVNLQDPDVYSRYMNCAWLWALPVNVSIFVAALYVVTLFGPPILIFFYTLFVWLLQVFQKIFLLLWFVVTDFSTNPAMDFDDESDEMPPDDDDENGYDDGGGGDRSQLADDNSIQLNRRIPLPLGRRMPGISEQYALQAQRGSNRLTRPIRYNTQKNRASVQQLREVYTFCRDTTLKGVKLKQA